MYVSMRMRRGSADTNADARTKKRKGDGLSCMYGCMYVRVCVCVVIRRFGLINAFALREEEEMRKRLRERSEPKTKKQNKARRGKER